MRNLYILQKKKSRRNWRPVMRLMVNGLSMMGMILSGIFTVAACSYEGPLWKIPLFMVGGVAGVVLFGIIETETSDESDLEEEEDD